MGLGDTSVTRRLRAEELESLLRGLPPEVLARAVATTLARLQGADRDLLGVAVDFVPHTAEHAPDPEQLLEFTLSVLARLSHDAHDVLGVAALEAASTAALGADLDAD